VVFTTALVWPAPRAVTSALAASLTLLRAPGVLVGQAPLSLEARLSRSIRHAEAFLVVYQASTSVSALEAALTQGQLGTPIAITRAKQLSAGQQTFQLRTPNPIPASGCGAGCSGVYPVQVRVASSQTGLTLASATFAVPYLTSEAGLVPLDVAAVVIASARGVGAGALESLLARDPTTSIAVDGDPARLAAVAELAGSIPRSDLVATPYVNLPGPCYGALGPASSFASAVAVGTSTTGAAGTVLVASEPLTAGELGQLRRGGTQAVVLPEVQLEGAAPVLGLTDPVRLGDGLQALGASPLLGSALVRGTDASGSQALLALLAQLYFEDPSQAHRVVVGVVQASTSAAVARIAEVLSLVGAAPFARLVSISHALGEPAVQLARVGTPPSVACPAPPRSLRELAPRVEALVEAAPRLADPIDATLLGALADPREATSASVALREMLAGLSVASDTLTLTSARQRVPIAVSSRLGVPVRLRLVLVDPKLRFPQGATLSVVVDRRTASIPVEVDSLALGTSPLEVRLESPTGALIATQVVAVNAIGFSSVGLVLTASSVVLLVWWWVRNRGSRRRARTPTRSSG